MNEREALITLALVPSIDLARFENVIAATGSASAALAAPIDLLRSMPGMSPAAATAMRSADLRHTEKVLASLGEMGATVLLYRDAEFPARLREIPDAPVILFALGRMELLQRPAVAVVGSRNNTTYGADVAHQVAAAASHAGITVVSGMARGLDAVAHQAALGGAGSTIGVLGNGLGIIYPAANRELYERVMHEGLLLSEFPPGERPYKGSFPRRNRLVSGLADVTVVVEAAHGSGALITAGTALEQGRDVMAVPGRITEPTAQGVNALIRDGAEPLLSVADLLAHYPGAEVVPGPAPTVKPSLPATLTGRERSIAELLLAGERPLDQVAELAALSIPETLVTLSTLELEGLVTRSAGSLFGLAPAPS
jgi:DNA processing protein